MANHDNNGAVYKINVTGDYTDVSPFASGLLTPYGLAEGADGRLFVSEVQLGRILELTSGSDYSIFASNLSIVDDIAFDSYGRLPAVQEYDGSVVDVTSGGDFGNAQPLVWGLGTYPPK